MGKSTIAAAALSLLVALAIAAGAGADDGHGAAPGCGEGPERVGRAILGTPCDDVIVAPPGVAVVRAGAGDDTIVGAAAVSRQSCPSPCFLDIGSQIFEGGPGDDVVFGQRGNDTLKGGEGNDRLYGGIGDDLLLGGPGEDLLAGGFGADTIDGEAGGDHVRGDGTIDRISDSGAGADTDVLSYSTGVTPGFEGAVATLEAEGFPPPGGERGLRFALGEGGQNAKQGIAGDGGGVDEVEVGGFEVVIGTPFSDYVEGSGRGEVIHGGGGADAIDGGPVEAARDTSKVSVGFMVPAQTHGAQLYLVGSDAGDEVHASYSVDAVEFELSGASFDLGAGTEAGCEVEAQLATCELSAPLDSLLLAGMGGDDAIEAAGFPAEVSVVAIGGAGDDELTGGASSEDVLVDGPDGGGDILEALGGDDALLHNGGPDTLRGGAGNDLFLSVSICDGETLEGGGGRDNASWARLPGEPVEARLDLGSAGEPGAGGPGCASGELDALVGIEDLEGSGAGDVLHGDGGPNQLLGHKGPDTYFALAGADRILANSAVGVPDPDPVIDCGADLDVAFVDIPTAEFQDATAVECETVIEAAPNDFNAPPEPPPAEPVPPSEAEVDATAPRTLVGHRPSRLLTVRRAPRRVAFTFLADESGVRFRCRIDRRPYRDCSSPVAYRVGLGRHVFKVFAVDAAGNRDLSPAPARFRVRRVVLRQRGAHRRVRG